MTVLNILSAVLLTSGGVLVVISALGTLRFRTTFKKLHAASVTETGGVLLMVSGMLLQCPHWLVAVKLIVMALLLMITNPVSSHALARTALYDGYTPELGDPPEETAT